MIWLKKKAAGIATAVLIAFAAGASVADTAGAALTPIGSSQPTLSGMLQFGTSSNGAYSTDDWNTIGGDVAYNLYVSQTGTTGAFINSGDGASTPPNIALSVGTYTFTIFGEGPGNPQSFYGLNLFFDGSSTAPSISVFAAAQTTTTAQPYFADAQGTPFLGPFPTQVATIVNGAGKTSFTDGNETISLTSYSWANPSVYGLDRVGQFNTTPDGANDFVGQFTLNVTAVPEPASLSFLAISALGLLSRRRVMQARFCNRTK